ncbi:MAG: transglutaminase-like cysteine peptidase [Proteobacteria bacterium]|nr:transglutaminase-like cysteine peptidase [Pseudomonadota bacterium]
MDGLERVKKSTFYRVDYRVDRRARGGRIGKRAAGNPLLLRLANFVTSLGLTILAASAHAAYPWQEGVYLADASALSHWNDTIERHDQQRDQLTSCIDDRDTCDGRLNGLAHLMSRAQGLTKQAQLRLVNRYINGKRYKNDRPTRTTSELRPESQVFRNSWSTPVEFVTKGGDCEDYASAKYFLLRDLGFSSDELRVVVTYETRSHGYHAVLAYRQTPDEIWLLDSDNTVRKSPAFGARFIYAVNEHGIWDHETDRQTIRSKG